MGLFEQWNRCFRLVVRLQITRSEVRDRLLCLQVAPPVFRLAQLQELLENVDGLVELVRLSVGQSEQGHRFERIEMIGAEFGFLNRDDPFEEWYRLRLRG